MSEAIHLEQLLREAGDDIQRSALENPSEDLSSAINDRTNLQGLARLEDPNCVLANQTAFNLFLKAVLYEHYQTSDTDLPNLTTSSLYEKLDIAHEVTNDPAFQRSLLDDLADESSLEVEKLLKATSKLLTSDQPAEDIGRLFEQLTPQKSRRKLGQFRTPPKIAKPMSQWTIQSGKDHILDPGMGAGALSAAAYQHKRNIDSKSTLSEIHGIDLSELALVMCATSLRLLNRGSAHNLHVGDFLNLNPAKTQEMDAVVANPPYSRHHEIDNQAKEQMNQQASEEADMSISSLSPLYVYFYIHATQFLSVGGRGSFITPSEFLETNYGVALKQFLLDEFDIQALVITDRETSLFEDAMTTTCISFLERKSSNESTGTTKFIRTDKWPGNKSIQKAVENGHEGSTEWGQVNHIEQDTLDPKEKWTSLFDPLDIEQASILRPFREISDVSRGIATGKNEYFCLNQATIEEWEIETEYLSPVIRSASKAEYPDYTRKDWQSQRDAGDKVWLLYHVDVWKPELQESKIGDYLNHGEETGADDSYLASHRTPWYVVDRRDPPDILFKYMSRSGGRFVYNRADVRNLNNIHGITLQEQYSEKDARALLAYLNSRKGNMLVQRAGREYMGGLSKLEPEELKNAPVIDPQQIRKQERDTLAELFDNLCKASRNNGKEKVLDEIDEALTNILDI